MGTEGSLTELRELINKTDDELVSAFVKRMELVGKIGKLKQEAGLPVFDASREQAVKERVLAGVPDELKPYVDKLYDSVFFVAKEYEQGKTDEI